VHWRACGKYTFKISSMFIFVPHCRLFRCCLLLSFYQKKFPSCPRLVNNMKRSIGTDKADLITILINLKRLMEGPQRVVKGSAYHMRVCVCVCVCVCECVLLEAINVVISNTIPHVIIVCTTWLALSLSLSLPLSIDDNDFIINKALSQFEHHQC
jgi:hypothetical protein